MDQCRRKLLPRNGSVATPRQATISVADIAGAAERLRVRPTDAKASIVLAEPYDPVVFDRGTMRDGLCVVAANVDCLPGRQGPVRGRQTLKGTNERGLAVPDPLQIGAPQRSCSMPPRLYAGISEVPP